MDREKRIEKYIREGRGHGEGGDYKPWLTIQNLSSNGNETRLRVGKQKDNMNFFLI